MRLLLDLRLKPYRISVIHFYASLTHISLFVIVNITEICDWGIEGPNPRIHDRCSLVSTGYANSYIWYLVHRKSVCHRDNPPRSGGNLMCLAWSSNCREVSENPLWELLSQLNTHEYLGMRYEFYVQLKRAELLLCFTSKTVLRLIMESTGCLAYVFPWRSWSASSCDLRDHRTATFVCGEHYNKVFSVTNFQHLPSWKWLSR